MILLDTHAWVWWIDQPEQLSRKAATEIAAADAVLICGISCWEISMLASKQRLRLSSSIRQWMQDATTLPTVILLPLTPSIAVFAGSNELALHGDPADRIIAATAIQ